MNKTSWTLIENQIESLSAIEQQIEKVRTLLAEDWQVRTSRPEAPTTAPDRVCC